MIFSRGFAPIITCGHKRRSVHIPFIPSVQVDCIMHHDACITNNTPALTASYASHVTKCVCKDIYQQLDETKRGREGG